jgi:hypothetical protein
MRRERPGDESDLLVERFWEVPVPDRFEKRFLKAAKEALVKILPNDVTIVLAVECGERSPHFVSALSR